MSEELPNMKLSKKKRRKCLPRKVHTNNKKTDRNYSLEKTQASNTRGQLSVLAVVRASRTTMPLYPILVGKVGNPNTREKPLVTPIATPLYVGAVGAGAGPWGHVFFFRQFSFEKGSRRTAPRRFTTE
jgi:hypothetical protein